MITIKTGKKLVRIEPRKNLQYLLETLIDGFDTEYKFIRSKRGRELYNNRERKEILEQNKKDRERVHLMLVTLVDDVS